MASEYKNLPINRDKIDETLKDYPGLKDFNIVGKPNDLFQYAIDIDDKPATLNIYFLKNGGTTFSPTGKNQEVAVSIAGYLKANCSKGDGDTKNLRLVNFSEDHKDLLFDYLITECAAEIQDPVNHSHGSKFNIIGRQGDSVVFWMYTNGACHLQGKQYSVYTDILEMLAEILDYKDVIDSQLKTINVDISVEEALNDMEVLLPSSFDFMQNKLKAIISPALALKKINIELTDYSSFVFPVLRGLEGYLKQVLTDFDIDIGKDGFGEMIDTDKYGSHVLSKETKSKISDSSKEKVILDLYKYFNKHRHGLFHVETNVEATRILETKEDSVTLIDSAIRLIEDAHKSLF